jgi:hypothetical protein
VTGATARSERLEYVTGVSAEIALLVVKEFSRHSETVKVEIRASDGTYTK